MSTVQQGDCAGTTASLFSCGGVSSLDDERRHGYLPDATFAEYLHLLSTQHPNLYRLLDKSRFQAKEGLATLIGTTTEFDSDATGRGDSYRAAQEDTSVRWHGVQQLLRLAVPPGSGGKHTVLDVLGGDGTVARAHALHAGVGSEDLDVVTGDISGEMVRHALARGLAAIRQAAQFSFLKSGSLDGVLLAYGTHHIPRADRSAAVSEAVRTVRTAGRVVLHDFDEASPMARFFSEVVHTHSLAGHDYEHFTRTELHALFRTLPVLTQVLDLYDPIVVSGRTMDEARRGLCAYVGDMYGVRDLINAEHPDEGWALLEQHFDHTDYLARRKVVGAAVNVRAIECEQGFIAELPRVAIVAVAQKHD